MYVFRFTTTKFLTYVLLLLATSYTASSLMRYPKLQFLLTPFRSSTKMTALSLDLPRVTASELQDLLTAGKIKSSQLVETYLSHIDENECYLNALIVRPS